MKHYFEECKLTIDCGEYIFEYPISKTYEVNEILLVLIGRHKDVQYGCDSHDRNIYAFDKKCNLIWIIQKAPYGESPKPYTNLYIEDEKLISHNWSGVEYVINTLDGTVSLFKEKSRPW